MQLRGGRILRRVDILQLIGGEGIIKNDFRACVSVGDCYNTSRMKRALAILSLVLLPMAAAESPAPDPASHHVAAVAASDRIKEAESACIALARPLPGGGKLVVAGAGAAIHEAVYLQKLMPAEDVGTLASVPENRVTRALNCPEARQLPDNWYDDKYKAYWDSSASIPADKVLELWYSALETLYVPVSWFCDEAGDNLVIITGRAANCHCYEMYLYQWDAAKQAFSRRGVYTIYSRLFLLNPTRVDFLPEGMRVSVLALPRGGGSLEYRRLFRFADGDTTYRFPDENLRWEL